MIPKWKGTDPQNKVLPSRNCDDNDETPNFIVLYCQIVPITKTDNAIYGNAISEKLFSALKRLSIAASMTVRLY
jgi:hypothetical protein